MEIQVTTDNVSVTQGSDLYPTLHPRVALGRDITILHLSFRSMQLGITFLLWYSFKG